MVDRSTLEESLRSVQAAHQVLDAFHREVVAFFQILDDQLADLAHGCSLKAFESNKVVWTSTSNVSRPEAWVPSYVGRLYYDESLDVEEEQPETPRSMSAALVAIYTPSGGDLPECWFGFGRPGEATRFTGGWNFARNGLWNYEFDIAASDAWARGKFEGNAYYGDGGVWAMRRTPLIELTSPDAIHERVSAPLLQEWGAIMRS